MRKKALDDMRADIYRLLASGKMSPEDAEMAISHLEEPPVEPSETKRVFGYCRVSTPDQAKGLSLDAQQRQLESYYEYLKVAHPGIQECTTLRDEGQSAYKLPFFQRDAGRRLRGILRAGDILVIAKTDRGFRNSSDFQQSLQILRNRGVILIFLDIGVDLSTPVGRLMASIMVAVAEFESSRRSERLLERNREAREKGYADSARRRGKVLVKAENGLKRLVDDLPALALMFFIRWMHKNRDRFCMVQMRLGSPVLRKLTKERIVVILDRVFAKREGRPPVKNYTQVNGVLYSLREVERIAHPQKDHMTQWPDIIQYPAMQGMSDDLETPPPAIASLVQELKEEAFAAGLLNA